MPAPTPTPAFLLQKDRVLDPAYRVRERRVDRLRRLERAVRSGADELAAAIARDFRKAPAETAMTEVMPVLAEIRHALAHLEEWMAPEPVATPITLAGASSEIRYEPRGVALIIAPWNYPFLLAISPLAAAWAAGCPVHLKPSELTPATSEFLARWVPTFAQPDEAVVRLGGAETSTELLTWPFDHVFFTGSTRVGKVVMRAAAEHLASVTLELGGKSPAIVDPSARLPDAAAKLAWGKLINAGQTCVAPDYVLVPAGSGEALARELRAAVDRAYGAGPAAWRASPDLARIVSDGHWRRLRGLVDDSVRAGARTAWEFAPTAADEAARYLPPTVLTGVRAEHAVMQEEIFGPVLPIVELPGDGDAFRDAAIRFVQAREKPLAAYFFARDEDAIEGYLERISAGGVGVNQVVAHLANADLPFGGVGPSGQGSYHGIHGFRAFSHAKAVLRQSRWLNAMKFVAPPYTPRVRRLVDLIARWA